MSETAPEAIPEEKENINGVQQLSREATAINQFFSQQVLQNEAKAKSFAFQDPSPFPAEGKEQIATTAYK